MPQEDASISKPQAMKFAFWTHPPGPSDDELTGCRHGLYSARNAPTSATVPMNPNPPTAPQPRRHRVRIALDVGIVGHL
jgi:hypothetical protein